MVTVLKDDARQILAAKGYPPSLIAAWEADGIKSLLPIQKRGLIGNFLESGNCIVVGPYLPKR